jgi:hypothetical protein
MESTMSEDDVAGVGQYQGAAAGWGALKAVADAVRGQMAVVKETRGLLTMNQPHGFDCPGCAWPDPKHTSSNYLIDNKVGIIVDAEGSTALAFCETHGSLAARLSSSGRRCSRGT